ncbi:MAG: hypothetical protein WB765_17590 [Acidimicrobiales bacterium]
MAALPNPVELLKSRSYLKVLVLAAAIGVPISALAYFFLELVAYTQHQLYAHLPQALGFHGVPIWWPVPLLAVSGLVVALAIKYLPGTGGHSPADGLQVGSGAPSAAELPGTTLAALATLILGAVLGPEAPLIAIGGGLGVCAVRLAKRDAPPWCRSSWPEPGASPPSARCSGRRSSVHSSSWKRPDWAARS